MPNVMDYWPSFASQEHRCFAYSTADGSLQPFKSVFSYDATTNSMLYDDYNPDGSWKDRWYLQYRPGFGLAEWRDDYPGKIIQFSTPIPWGDEFAVGDSASGVARIDWLRSWPPLQFGSCFQAVWFEKIFDTFQTRDGTVHTNVLQMAYLQNWGKSCNGARYWMALGVGPIAIEWLGIPPDEIKFLPDMSKIHLVTSSRLDAVVTHT